ncbi:MAG TPA: amidase family protein, partial [Opitutaceae bacterium]|nr:amidase family protein [Opitutaceae bacterium]
MRTQSFDFKSLRAAYQAGLSPVAVIDEVYRRIADRGEDHVWIHLLSQEDVRAQAAALAGRATEMGSLPLFGLPFAIKDNIDVAGLPTTAACPDYAYVAKETAPAVQRLLDAGAILIGKTNLDQFATGLVGVRSPYGAPSSVFNKDYISGGSSSGSSVAVAAGLVSFALGTDTAGSGRVPA